MKGVLNYCPSHGFLACLAPPLIVLSLLAALLFVFAALKSVFVVGIVVVVA